MRVNIGNALEEASPVGVPRSALERLDRRVATAHDRIQSGRDGQEMGYAALNLPAVTDPDAIERAVEPFRDASVFLAIGIGGSALGAATLADALDRPSPATRSAAGEEHTGGPPADGDKRTVVLDNVDPAHTRAVLDSIALSDTVINVVSRSGTTVETVANFLLAREAMSDAGLDWTERTIVTTGPDGPLRDMADRHELPTLDVPAGVPGRFSVLSPVGLTAAAFEGHDVEAILEGATKAEGTLSPSLFETPAYAYGAVLYALDQRGVSVNAMMPYAESLERFTEWFAQLWAESLGKDGLGQTPVGALGATDQHSQLQLYRAGPLDKVVSLLRPRTRPTAPVPSVDVPELDYLDGSSLDELIDTEFEATEASLNEAGVPNVRIEVDAVDERGLGELCYTMEAACILAGELYDVETFTQPAVEWGKRAARNVLAGDETFPEQPSLAVED